MAINLATKYSDKVQERFYRDSVTQSAFSKDLDMEFQGVKTVIVYEADTAPLNDYTRSGSNRYGTPSELGDTTQEFTMEVDKGFTYTIDKGNAKEQFNVKQAGTSLKRQMREVVTPFIDKYRMNKWAQKAGFVKGVAAPTKTTIAEMIMDCSAELDNALVPADNREIYFDASYFKYLKLCPEYVALDSVGEKAVAKGVVGEFDGMKVKKIPHSLMPGDCYFIIIHKGSCISPMKLQDYKIHTDPPGISGDLVEGRVIFDAFVKGTKAKGILAAVASAKVAATPTVSFASHVATMACTTSGAVIRYTTDGTDPRYSTTAQTYNASAKPTVEAGTTVKMVAEAAGYYPAIGEGTDTGA